MDFGFRFTRKITKPLQKIKGLLESCYLVLILFFVINFAFILITYFFVKIFVINFTLRRSTCVEFLNYFILSNCFCFSPHATTRMYDTAVEREVRKPVSRTENCFPFSLKSCSASKYKFTVNRTGQNYSR